MYTQSLLYPWDVYCDSYQAAIPHTKSILSLGCDSWVVFDVVPFLFLFLFLAYDVYHERNQVTNAHVNFVYPWDMYYDPDQVANPHAMSILSLGCDSIWCCSLFLFLFLAYDVYVCWIM